MTLRMSTNLQESALTCDDYACAWGDPVDQVPVSDSQQGAWQFTGGDILRTLL